EMHERLLGPRCADAINPARRRREQLAADADRGERGPRQAEQRVVAVELARPFDVRKAVVEPDPEALVAAQKQTEYAAVAPLGNAGKPADERAAAIEPKHARTPRADQHAVVVAGFCGGDTCVFENGAHPGVDVEVAGVAVGGPVHDATVRAQRDDAVARTRQSAGSGRAQPLATAYEMRAIRIDRHEPGPGIEDGRTAAERRADQELRRAGVDDAQGAAVPAEHARGVGEIGAAVGRRNADPEIAEMHSEARRP